MWQGRPLKGLIFDLDGTLVESLGDLRYALNVALANFGRPPLDNAQIMRMVGDGIPKLVERGLEATGEVPGDAELASVIADCIQTYKARPAVE